MFMFQSQFLICRGLHSRDHHSRSSMRSGSSRNHSPGSPYSGHGGPLPDGGGGGEVGGKVDGFGKTGAKEVVPPDQRFYLEQIICSFFCALRARKKRFFFFFSFFGHEHRVWFSFELQGAALRKCENLACEENFLCPLALELTG